MTIARIKCTSKFTVTLKRKIKKLNTMKYNTSLAKKETAIMIWHLRFEYGANFLCA